MGKITEPSDAGLEEIIKSEGIYYQVYDDATGKVVSSYEEVKGFPTIGVGHLIKDKERSTFAEFLGGRKKMSKSQVFQLFKSDMPKYSKPIADRLKEPVTQSMFDALVSLAFNAGTNAKSLKAAIAAINNKDYKQAAQEILNGPTTSKGRKLKGLVKRREREASLFLKEGTPGAFLQRLFFWTGVTAGTIAASILGWRYVSKKFLGSSDE
jgi:GH24 family phage-related lysozyme (muramidase)